MRARGSTLEPGAMDGIIRDLTEMYGLQGSWLDQYWAFWGRLFHGDFGVSFFQFPTRVNQLIATAMPWTLGLLLTTTAISWILGNIIGGLAGYYLAKGWSRTLDAVAMVIRPLPYYIFAFALLLLLAWVVRWFPITGGASMGAIPTFTWAYIKDVLWHSFLPALSLSDPGRGSHVPNDEADRTERQCGKFCPVCQAGRRYRRPHREQVRHSQRLTAANHRPGPLAWANLQRGTDYRDRLWLPWPGNVAL